MASQNKDRVQEKQAADLLRRSLASPSGAPGSEIGACPDPEILAAYSERTLDPEEAARWNTHFAQCARCREQLVVLVRARDSAGTTEKKRPQASGLVWDWRWLAPAAAAIIFVIIVQVFRPSHRAGEQALVASNQPAAPPASSATPESAAPESSRSVRETPPARVAVPLGEPLARSAAGSVQRIAPSDSTSMTQRMKQEPENLLSENDKKLQQSQQSTELPLGSCYTPLDGSPVPPAWAECNAAKMATAPAAPKTQSLAQNENAYSTSEPRKPPTAQPSTPESASAVSGGNAIAQPTAVAKPARSEHLSAAVATNRSLAQTETVEVQAGDETSARTLVRSPDPQVLWRFSSGRYVERSSDAGTTWRVQWTSPNAHLVAGAAPTADTCWLVGRDAMILVITDGKKWRTIAPPADTDFVDVTATDASSATVTSTDGRKFTTSDSGRHWTPAP